MQAQAKVLGAERPDPSGGRAKLGAAAESEHRSVVTASPREAGVGFEQPSPFPHGRRPMSVGEGNGLMQPTFAPAHGWWHQVNGRRPKAGMVSGSRGPAHKPEARRWEIARSADRVVVAKTPGDSITPAERRTRGAEACSTERGSSRHAFGPTGTNDHVAEESTKGAPNSPGGPVMKDAPDASVRSLCLEAVLGKTRRTEF